METPTEGSGGATKNVTHREGEGEAIKLGEITLAKKKRRANKQNDKERSRQKRSSIDTQSPEMTQYFFQQYVSSGKWKHTLPRHVTYDLLRSSKQIYKTFLRTLFFSWNSKCKQQFPSSVWPAPQTHQQLSFNAEDSEPCLHPGLWCPHH